MIADLSNDELAQIEVIRAELERHLPKSTPSGERGRNANDDRVFDTVRLDLDDLNDTEPPPDG
jgi:hypothetical protein